MSNHSNSNVTPTDQSPQTDSIQSNVTSEDTSPTPTSNQLHPTNLHDDSDPAPRHQTDPRPNHDDKSEMGDVTALTVDYRRPADEALTHARGDPLTVSKRLQKRADWPEISAERDRLISEGRKLGLLRREAQQRAYEELDRRYPPRVEPSVPEPVAATQAPATPARETVSAVPSTGVSGLGDLPSSWPTLPPNASLQAEVAWVAANRLAVVVRPGVVDLSRALAPAPSYSALDWLETALVFPAKFADIRVKAAQGVEDEREQIRRERLAIQEIRDLLAEMVDGPD